MAPPPERFHEAYANDSAPWDFDGPQPAFVELADAGKIRGTVLDVGCGTGENACMLAQRGFEVWGVDLVPKAVETAQAKLAARGLSANLQAGDALDLSFLGRTFDTLIDSGVFHVFNDEDRPRFVTSLRSVIAPGGWLYALVFSHLETGERGPRRMHPEEFAEAFADGWRVVDVAHHRYRSRAQEGGARALLAQIQRLE